MNATLKITGLEGSPEDSSVSFALNEGTITFTVNNGSSCDDTKLSCVNGSRCDVTASTDLTGGALRCLLQDLPDGSFDLTMHRTSSSLTIRVGSELLQITSDTSVGFDATKQMQWTQRNATVLIDSWAINIGYGRYDSWCMQKTCVSCAPGSVRKNSDDDPLPTLHARVLQKPQ